MGIEYIKQVKKERGITTDALSDKSGVPLGTLNKILSGQTADPKFETLKAICRALDISLAALDDDQPLDDIQTAAAHFDGSQYSQEQLERIKAFAAFIKNEDKK